LARINVAQKQQELSEKFGIPTFTSGGRISTVPTSGKINKNINVGLGNFKSSEALNRAINAQIAANQKKVDSKIQTSFPDKSRKTAFDKKPETKGGDKPIVLGEKTIEAQRKLSEQFKIVTFDPKGRLSTIPKPDPVTGQIVINDIVGRGAFKTDDEFTKAIATRFGELNPTPNPIQSFGESVTSFFGSLFSPEPPKIDIILQNPLQADPSPAPDVVDEQGGGLGGAAGLSVPPPEEQEKKGIIDRLQEFIEKNPLGALLVIGGGTLLLAGVVGGGKGRR